MYTRRSYSRTGAPPTASGMSLVAAGRLEAAPIVVAFVGGF
jgi:hypothetical protein